jgi:hypothetical protein
MTAEERALVADALDAIEAGTWDRYLWFEDIDAEGWVVMWVNESVLMVWRLYPGTDDAAQVIYVGHPRLYG